MTSESALNAVSDVPVPPSDLSERARRMWVEVLEENDPLPADRELLAEALRALDEADAARVMIERDGLVVTDRYGSPKAHPAADIEHRRRAFFMAAMKQLGLHGADEPEPSPRSRRETPGPKPRRMRSVS